MLKKSGIIIISLLLSQNISAQNVTSVTTSLNLSQQVSQARFAVLIPEVILRRPVPDPAAETEIMHALVNSGYRLVDPGSEQRTTERDLLLNHDPNAIPDLQARLNADYLITGEAFAEEYGSVAGGLRAYTARLEVKILDLASNQVIYSEAFQSSAVGATDAIAGKTALMKVGNEAGQKLPVLINQMLQGGKNVAHHVYRIRIEPPVNFAQANALAKQLKSGGIKDVFLRNVAKGGAILEISSDKDVNSVANDLERYHLTIDSLTGKEITVKF